MKDEVGRKIKTKFFALKLDSYGYWTDDSNENKKTKKQK